MKQLLASEMDNFVENTNDEHDELFYLINDPDLEVIDDEDELEMGDISFSGYLQFECDGITVVREKENNGGLSGNTEMLLKKNSYSVSIFSSYIIDQIQNNDFIVKIFHEGKLLFQLLFKYSYLLSGYEIGSPAQNRFFIGGQVYDYNTVLDENYYTIDYFDIYDGKFVDVNIEILK